MEMEKLDEDSGRWSGAIPVLPVAILAGALLSGCASMIYETPNGGVRTVVSPLVNQHLIVITNESRVTAKISVNGNPACLWLRENCVRRGSQHQGSPEVIPVRSS